MVRAAVLAATLLLCTACAPGRMADLRDAGRLSAGLAFGLSADAKLGTLTHPSLGLFSAGAQLGSDSRKVWGFYFEARTSDPYATYFSRTRGKGKVSWPDSINGSGWRATFDSETYGAALTSINDGIMQQAPQAIVEEFAGGEINGELDIGKWLPIPRQDGLDVSFFDFNSVTDFQLGVTLLLVNARVGFNLLETADFLLGFAGLDIAGDDEEE